MDLPDDPLRLEVQVCFSLSAAARAMVALYKPILEPLGLTHPQYLVMLGLWQDERAGRLTTVTGLAARLLLDPGTLSPLLKRLERQGLLERRRTSADARVVELHLTDAGRALRAQAEKVPAAVVEASGLSLAELDAARVATERVIAAAHPATV
ncbi:MarR family winged helix-turn-helix transcriptional regulator [Isoptericola cucumis]|uniref:MarR family transcriptional regulator n=1 Tax=Isoptericola cucumis TaxID=1776856 RepID=A0ABQ2B006_9MICO|nr:MarR family transcriptional regulator [Isoptericola cucumis]GGI04600.1 MarR family transcriptional regulator [Isoptericola cucumis]